MIVEMRTYLLRPGTVPDAEALFLKNYPHRAPLSPMAGLWHAISGQLNTLIHLWPYATVEERMQVRAEAMKSPHWPPPLRPYLQEMDARIILPAPFSPKLEPAEHGSVYEFCIDSFLPGGPADFVSSFQGALEARARLSPLIFCGTSEFGRLNEVVHVWAYRDVAHWAEVQQQLQTDKTWPPVGGKDRLMRQQAVLASPAEVSLLK